MTYRIMAAVVAACTMQAAEAQEFYADYVEIAEPRQPGEVFLPTVSPDTPDTEQWMTQNGVIGVRNVSKPTLVPVLPAGPSTGAAVIVAPGGAFLGLAIDHEGWQVARWLANHGIAAFVLKYRLLPTPRDNAQFRDENNAVRNSGTISCPTGARGEPSTVTITGTDTTAVTAPTTTGSGNALPANTAYIASFEMSVAVPMAAPTCRAVDCMAEAWPDCATGVSERMTPVSCAVANPTPSP